MIVVEAKKGNSGFAVGTNNHPTNLSARPDLQIESNMPMGTPEATPGCDNPSLPPSAWGGIAAVPTPGSFGPDPSITVALRDFACRFGAAFSPTTPCTLVGNGMEGLGNPTPNPDAQFCDSVSLSSAFPLGLSILTVQVRDAPTPGPGRTPNIGPTAQIVVRVITPTPSPQ